MIEKLEAEWNKYLTAQFVAETDEVPEDECASEVKHLLDSTLNGVPIRDILTLAEKGVLVEVCEDQRIDIYAQGEIHLNELYPDPENLVRRVKPLASRSEEEK